LRRRRRRRPAGLAAAVAMLPSLGCNLAIVFIIAFLSKIIMISRSGRLNILVLVIIIIKVVAPLGTGVLYARRRGLSSSRRVAAAKPSTLNENGIYLFFCAA
jgi:hypothetical protein